jgi:Fe2+ transport system protein FeoA
MLNLTFWRSPIIKTTTQPISSARQLALSRVPVGKVVIITGFGRLSAAQSQHLQAYGLLPGRTIQVLAQRPVTIVLVEQTELAFETEIAAQILTE